MNPFGYHAINLALHIANALLLWLLLTELGVPAAWLAAAVFALHPINAESVAWVTERKNVQSLFFWLLSFLVYARYFGLTPGRFRERTTGPPRPRPSSHRWLLYGAGLLLFICALLSKTVTAAMPAALLLTVWWLRGTVNRREMLAAAPLIALGAAMGLCTVWLEKHHVGASGAEWSLGIMDHILLAGRILWFYVGKLLWPAQLMFIYPRWQIDSAAAWQYLFPAAALLLALILWLLRGRIGRGPFAAAACYTVMLAPALGFFDVYPMRFSYVADHFVYHAALPLIILFCGGASAAIRPHARRLAYPAIAASAALLAALCLLTWRHAGVFMNLETLWTDTLEKNQSAWMAHNNLGVILLGRQQADRAIRHLSEAVRLKPDYDQAHNNLGNALVFAGRPEEAQAQFSEAVRLNPNYAPPHYNLGNLLVDQKRWEEAEKHFLEAVRLDSKSAIAHFNYGNGLELQGRLDKAAAQYKEALRLDPALDTARARLQAVNRAGSINEQ